jgi:hypothetical protein
MRINSQDQTLKRNYIQVYRHYIEEYEQVKNGLHPLWKRVGEFYAAHQLQRQTFLKYYARFKLNSEDSALLPAKRGPRWKTRRTPAEVEQLVLAERERGCNRYEIHSLLKPKLADDTPATSTVYAILKRYGKNRLSKPMQEEKRKIIKEKAGELAHLDCYHLAKDTILGERRNLYLVCALDDCTRLAWAEPVEDITALTVMFASLRCLNQLAERYHIKFQELMTDNGPEFGPANSQNKQNHPFERMLIELGIKHRYTRPYRPQTNGKVERFWRTLNEDLIQNTTFNSWEYFKNELAQYLLYYNTLRPHQAIKGLSPNEFNKSCQRIT